ncbi:MAG: type I phosphomannose isomerase catalytic subunit, partial [Planctomycetota bacterium]
REILSLAEAEENIGETWELYDRPDGSSAIRDSELTLRDLMEQDAEALLGARAARRFDRFPILIKFIDSREALSIQVHPEDAQASEDGDSGKSEAWVVLAVGPEGRIIRGLKPGVGTEELADKVDSADISELLHSFKPNVGDVIPVPAGTVHSIGPDVVVFEVQQNSDLTYRLYDWGRPRDLQVEKALRAVQADAASWEPARTTGQWGAGNSLILDDEQFRVHQVKLDDPQKLETQGTVKVISVLRGAGTLGWRSGGQEPPLTLQKGDTVLVPALTKEVFVSPIGGLEFFWTDPGVEG